jgi:hypothetical protein
MCQALWKIPEQRTIASNVLGVQAEWIRVPNEFPHRQVCLLDLAATRETLDIPERTDGERRSR